MKSSHVMSKELISVFDSTSVYEAFKMMKDNDCRHLIVRNKSLQVVGILSDRDLLRAQNKYDSKKFDFDPDENVSAYMTRSLQSVDLNDDLTQALRLMLEKEISSILVKDKETLIGIMTSYDAILLLIRILEGRNFTLKPKISHFFQQTADEIAVQLAKIGFL